MILKIRDETLTGDILNETEIETDSQTLYLKDLIALRVQSEVERYNQEHPTYFRGLIKPNESEETLNGFKLKNKKVIDTEEQIYIAFNSFQNNGYLVLVNDKQQTDLEETIQLHNNSVISFLKLTPLIGG
jgi:hypothetical protein